MNIRTRMLKVANNLIENVIKSFEMTEDEWKKYSELHPNAKRENHQILPSEKNNFPTKIDIAKNDKTPEKILSKMIKNNPSRELAIELLKNQNTPNDDDVFSELAYDFLANDDYEGVDYILNNKNSDHRTAIEIANVAPDYFDRIKDIEKKHWWSYELDEKLEYYKNSDFLR